MQSTITQDLNAAITKFTEQDIFNNVKDIVEFLRANTQTTYRYKHYGKNQSLICKKMPKLVETAKGEIKEGLESREMGSRASLESLVHDMEDKQLIDKQAEEAAWNNIMQTNTSDAKQTHKQLLKDILEQESEETKKSIAKNFNIAYKTLRLHASNPAPQQNDHREESKEPAKNIESQEEIGLEYLLQDSHSMQTNLGSQAQGQGQGAVSMISAILTKRKAQENNNLNQRELNLDEKSIQTILDDQGETPRVTLHQEEPNDKNQGDDQKKREKKWTLKDELNKRMQGSSR